MHERLRPAPDAKLFIRRWVILAAIIIPLGFGIDWFVALPSANRTNLFLIFALFVVPAVAVVCFLLLVWPTLWRYDRVGSTMARIRRFDGRTEVLTPQGWQRVTDSSGLPLT